MSKRKKIGILDLSSDELFCISEFFTSADIARSLFHVCKRFYLSLCLDIVWESRSIDLGLSRKSTGIRWLDIYGKFVSREQMFRKKFLRYKITTIHEHGYNCAYFSIKTLKENGNIMEVRDEKYVTKNKIMNSKESSAIVKNVETTPLLDACLLCHDKGQFKAKGDYESEVSVEENDTFNFWREYSKEEFVKCFTECLQPEKYERFRFDPDGKFVLTNKELLYHNMWGYCLGCLNNRDLGKLFKNEGSERTTNEELDEQFKKDCYGLINLVTEENPMPDKARFFFTGVEDEDLDRTECVAVMILSGVYLFFMRYSRYWG